MVGVDSERHNMVGPNKAAPTRSSWEFSGSHGDDVTIGWVATRVWERRRNFLLKKPFSNSSNAKPSPWMAAWRIRSSTCGMSFNMAGLKVTRAVVLDEKVTGSNLVGSNSCVGKEVTGVSGIVAWKYLPKLSWNLRWPRRNWVKPYTFFPYTVLVNQKV